MLRDRTTVKLQPGLFLQPFVVSQLTGAIMSRVVEGSGITSSEFAVTSSVAVFESVTPTELARTLGLSPTTLSAMVDRLVRKGQLRRVRHPEDGRSYVLELTPAGQATNGRNVKRFAAELQTLRGNLEGDSDEALDAMRRLEAALRQTLGAR
jgi:DNA-binding MarR family transcriptional regulator